MTELANLDRSEPELDDSTVLSADRTRLAHDRTLMAWLRTAVSLISFGFAIYKFGEELIEKGAISPDNRLLGSHNFALIMISCGLLALVLAIIEHRMNMKALRVRYGLRAGSLVAVFAGLISCLGIVSLLGVLFRQ